LKSPEVKPQQGSAKEPIPGAPGQTQFFMAAAQVSSGAKIRRVLIFVLGAIIVGTGLFLLIRFAMQQQEEKREDTVSEKPAAAATMPEPTIPVPVAGESQDGGAAAPAADAGKEEAQHPSDTASRADEKITTKEEKKPAKRKKKRKRSKRRTR
jgi:hypothetical protein